MDCLDVQINFPSNTFHVFKSSVKRFCFELFKKRKKERKKERNHRLRGKKFVLKPVASHSRRKRKNNNNNESTPTVYIEFKWNAHTF